MGSQLRWLERTPDKREVDGSIPFEPTKGYFNLVFVLTKYFFIVKISKQHIEKYIDKCEKSYFKNNLR